MKYIISDERLTDFMRKYLDKLVNRGSVSNLVNFILIWETDDAEEEDEPVMEFDYEDGRLWVRTNYLKFFSDLFAQDQESALEFIKNWFEDRFGVKVMYTQS